MARLRTHHNRVKSKETREWLRRLRIEFEPFGIAVIPIREYHKTIKNADKNGIPVPDGWRI